MATGATGLAADATGFLGPLPTLYSRFGPTIINGLIIVSTISGQSLIGKLTFSCPCAFPLNIYHSCAFIFGPTVALFMFAMLINGNTWKLVHGCCYRTHKSEHPCGMAVIYWLQIFAESSIAPVAWLFVAFLNGSYYACMRAGDFCHVNATTQCQNSTAVEVALATISVPLITIDKNICPLCVCNLDTVSDGYLHSESQVIAWLLIVCVGVIALTSVCLVRMCDKYTYVQNTYVHMYRTEEKAIFDDIAREKARAYAKANAEAFFKRDKHSKEDWDIISSLPSIQNPYIFRKMG
uniref:7TM_GPCR_Srx domain-containing protein n=1 Tax=Panagrellus redivivus TaxID=6233 RepID=A0A7E4W6M1_PANRE